MASKVSLLEDTRDAKNETIAMQIETLTDMEKLKQLLEEEV